MGLPRLCADRAARVAARIGTPLRTSAKPLAPESRPLRAFLAQTGRLCQEDLERDSGEQIRTPAEAAIWHLYHTIAKRKLPDNCTGAEWWVQVCRQANRSTCERRLGYKVYEGGSGLAFHFDKDEQIYKTAQKMIHPDFSSILYLTGSDDDRLRQGLEASDLSGAECGCLASTVVLDQRFDSEQSKTDPPNPTGCVFIPPTAGKYCLFDGKLGHGVLDASNTERRATLLINWWKNKPQAVHRPSIENLRQLGAQERTQCPVLIPPPPGRSADLQPTPQAPYPVIRIPSEDEDIKECGILVDDLLDAYLLDAFGENAIQAVSVWYSGHVLYPIDPSKTKQDISKKLVIPAAFVPEGVEVGP